MSSRSIHVTWCVRISFSFIRLNNIPLYVQAISCLSIHLLIGCFHPVAMVNDAARNMGVFIHLFCCCQPLKSFINYSFTNQASTKIIPQIFALYLPSLLCLKMVTITQKLQEIGKGRVAWRVASTVLQRVRHDWATEQQQLSFTFVMVLFG